MALFVLSIYSSGFNYVARCRARHIQIEKPLNTMNSPTCTTPREGLHECLSIVMPVYNEAASAVAVAHHVLAQSAVHQLVIVDDGSADGTWETLQVLKGQDPRVTLVRHEQNRGKGAALRTGFQHASAPIVMIQDADFEYNPAEYDILLKPILNGEADVVIGSRFLGAGAHRVMYYWHAVGNRILTTLSNMATNLNLTDMEACYKVFRREVLQQISIEENRFGFEPEIVAKVARLNIRVFEVPISYYGRTYEEGKKINWKDGVSALRCIVKYNLLRRLPRRRKRPVTDPFKVPCFVGGIQSQRQ